jgi:tetratricopeptide (TPR) repeat protein
MGSWIMDILDTLGFFSYHNGRYSINVSLILTGLIVIFGGINTYYLHFANRKNAAEKAGIPHEPGRGERYSKMIVSILFVALFISIFYHVFFSPPSVPELNRQGEALRAEGRYNESIACFQKAIGMDDNNEQAWIGMGRCYAQLENYRAGIECYERAIRLNGMDPEPVEYEGWALCFDKQYDRALEYFVKAERLDVDSPWVPLLGKGWCLFKKKDIAGAEACFQQASERYANQALVWYWKGKFYFDQDRFTDAESCFKEAVAIDGSFSSARELLTEVQKRVGHR